MRSWLNGCADWDISADLERNDTVKMNWSTFRYDTGGSWFKGNCHIHSTVSDGGKTFVELAQMYSEAGYDFLFRTDHWVPSDVDADAVSYPLLWLDGIELHGQDHVGTSYHVVCLGRFEGLTREMGLVTAMEAVRAQGGLLILAHPQWMGNSIGDARRWGFHGVEIYNHVCRWLNGKGEGLMHWNAVLEQRASTLGLAVDDAHLRPEHPGWNGGWIMVKAARRSRDAILGAIRAGSFYSSCGPEFLSIEWDGENVTVQTSPVQFVRLVGPAERGARIGSFDGQRYDRAAFQVPRDWPYVYLEIEDECGRRAWTNSLFVDPGQE
jgi:hypothetical protein